MIFLPLTILLYIGIWFLWCNHKTFEQRIYYIDYDTPEYQKFTKVTYNKHWWYLITFRDPSRLYK